jgi:hypothetical protein
MMLVGAFVGAAAGWGLVHLVKPHSLKGRTSDWILLSLPISMLLVIALHEAGHLVGGLASGFRFYLYVVGPLRIERDGERLKFMFNNMPALWGGLAGCTPRTYGPELWRKMLLMVAGGPAFSFLGALLTLPLGALFIQTHANVAIILIFFGFLSAAIGFVTLIPNHMAGFTSDGARLLMLVRKRPEGKRWTAMAAVGGLTLAERPKLWPMELMELLGDGSDGSRDAVAVCQLRYLWHADRREWELARVWLERGLEHMDALPKVMQGAYCACAAHYYARHGKDAAMARQYLDLARKPGFHNPEHLHGVAAAVLICEERKEEALKELDLAEQVAKSKQGSLGEASREELAEMRTEAL